MATVNVKHGKAQTTGKRLGVRPAQEVRASAAPQKVREEYGVSQTLLARLLGIDQATLASWEKTDKLAKDAQAKVRKVADLLRGLSRVMPKTELAKWFTKPSDACRAAGGNTPADLMEK